MLMARLPEWDHAAQISRPDWVTVEAWPPAPADSAVLDRLAGSASAARRIEALVRQARLGVSARLKRQHEGDALDLDAAITAAVGRRAGETPELRVYRRTERRVRDVAALLMVDRSASTADQLPGGRARVIDVLIDATFMLAHAGDRRVRHRRRRGERPTDLRPGQLRAGRAHRGPAARAGGAVFPALRALSVISAGAAVQRRAPSGWRARTRYWRSTARRPRRGPAPARSSLAGSAARSRPPGPP